MSKPSVKKAATARESSSAPRIRKAASKGERTAAAPVEASEAPRASKNILTAGIKALANAHGEAVARQSRVFESLLGLGNNSGRNRDAGPGDKPSLAAALDPFGFKKFEDVFDQRVARTLLRLGVPSAQAVADLSDEVERLRAEVARLKSRGKTR